LHFFSSVALPVLHLLLIHHIKYTLFVQAKDDYVDDTFALVPRELASIYFEGVANSFESCLPLVPPPPPPPPPSVEAKEPFRSPFAPSATVPERAGFDEV